MLILVLGVPVSAYGEPSFSCEGVKHYEHPEAGRLVFEFTVLEVVDERMSSLRLVAYVPAPGTGTREKMAKLLSEDGSGSLRKMTS